ncbi:MAG: GNAT family N-acetyltransferase [Candidatus Nanoarchaeia archaeon]|nr:GNAT family N-acetyltransferase [Candidatus Nanoarchaeia archaeon]
MKLLVREMKEKDIPLISKIYSECFPIDCTSKKDYLTWIKCNYQAKPRFVYYIAELNKELIGYILWIELGGFRKEAVIELEQIGVSEKMRGKGIGTILIKKSLDLFVKDYIRPRKIELIKLTTSNRNQAQNLYRKVLGAEPECVMKGIFGGDELIMFTRKYK